MHVDFLIDTGVNPNVLHSDIFDSIPEHQRPALHQSDMILRNASGDSMSVRGETMIDLVIEGRRFLVPVIIADAGSLHGILGMRFLVDRLCILDLRRGILKIDDQEIVMNQVGRTSCSRMDVVDNCHDRTLVKGHVDDSLWRNADVIDVGQEAFGSSEKELVIPGVVKQGHAGRGRLTETNGGIDKVVVLRGTENAELQSVGQVKEVGVVDSSSRAIRDLKEYDSDSLPEHSEGTEHDDELGPELMELFCGSHKTYHDILLASDHCNTDNEVAVIVSDEDFSRLDLLNFDDGMVTDQVTCLSQAHVLTINDSMRIAEQNQHETHEPIVCETLSNDLLDDNIETSDLMCDVSVLNSCTKPDNEVRECDCADLPEHLQGMIPTESNLDDREMRLLCGLLNRYQDIFMAPDGKLGRTGQVKHRIYTCDSPPIKQPPRRLSMTQKKIVEDEIEKMLASDVIEPSESSWASLVVLVTKKDGSPRFCVDYRRLNQVTRKDAYPLPNITDCIDALSGSGWFCTLDLASGYWQVEMDDESKPLTAFVTHKGLYQFKVLPFGLTNAPGMFERLMEQILRGLQWEKCLVYLDDIIIFGSDFLTALSNLRAVFERIEAASLRLKPKKCNFFQREVAFLGHVVTPDGVACDPAKTETVSNWLAPQTVTEVRSFLGLASYYRRFINGFATIASPLTALTEKGRTFFWSEECSHAFEVLKKKLVEAPILAYPSSDLADPFVLDTDASDSGIGAVLSQVQDGTERVIAYASKTLNHSQRRYCTTYRELLAVVVFVKRFRHYLIGQKFTVRTDHSSLRWLTNFKDAEGMVGRWLSSLSPYDFVIEHRSGASHGNADGLSRKMIQGKRR